MLGRSRSFYEDHEVFLQCEKHVTQVKSIIIIGLNCTDSVTGLFVCFARLSLLKQIKLTFVCFRFYSCLLSVFSFNGWPVGPLGGMAHVEFGLRGQKQSPHA